MEDASCCKGRSLITRPAVLSKIYGRDHLRTMKWFTVLLLFIRLPTTGYIDYYVFNPLIMIKKIRVHVCVYVCVFATHHDMTKDKVFPMIKWRRLFTGVHAGSSAVVSRNAETAREIPRHRQPILFETFRVRCLFCRSTHVTWYIPL